jgi:hypothetical protein
MITSKSRNPRLSDLRRFIKRAWEAWYEEQDQFREKFPGVAPQGPPWPFIAGDKIAERVSSEQGTLNQSRRKFLARLEQFQYPYPEGNLRKATFYNHLKDLGLWGLLSSRDFIIVIRWAWFLWTYHELTLELRVKKQSQYGYPLEFHRKMMLEIAGHLGRLDKLSSKYAAPESWFARYRAEILKQLLREASIVYPELRRWSETSHAIRPRSLKVEAQLDVLNAIRVQFAKKRIRNNKLAYQLTALICSPDSCIAAQKLDPTPEKVRRNVRDRGNKFPKKKSVKSNP